MDCNEKSLEKCFLDIMDITYSSAVDGEGFRDVLFVNYCPHRCPGCHNPETWDKKNGRQKSLFEIYKNLTKSSLTNVTYSGGEPFCQCENLLLLSQYIKKTTKKTIWIYSGYTFEEIMADEKKKELLKICNVLVDGRFEKEHFVENLRFKGSENQRIIDIEKSLQSGSIVLWEDDSENI